MIVFVCVAALAILNRLDVVDIDTLGWWLAERQLPNGGLNGRPEKLEDVSHPDFFFSHLVLPLPTPVTPLTLLPGKIGLQPTSILLFFHTIDPILCVLNDKKHYYEYHFFVH
jgi:hypothetical protein